MISKKQSDLYRLLCLLRRIFNRMPNKSQQSQQQNTETTVMTPETSKQWTLDEIMEREG
jgi:hypothetical protein